MATSFNEYWVNFGQQRITEGHATINSAAQKLGESVSTFWGWYTLVFVIGTSIKKLDEPNYVLFLLALPIPLLIISFILTSWVQMPIIAKLSNGKEPEENSPDDIRELYSITIREKKKRLTWAYIFVFLTGITLAFALYKANFTNERKDATPQKDTVAISLIATDTLSFVSVNGNLPDGHVYLITLDSMQEDQYQPLHTGTGTVLEKDHFEYSHKLHVVPDYLKVTVTWKETGEALESKSMTKVFSKAGF